MKRIITIVLVAILTMAAVPAQAGAPTDDRVAALGQQVKLLKNRVKALEGELRPLRRQVRVLRETVDSMQGEIQEAITLEKNRDLCVAVGVADLLQSTWTNIDKRVASSPAFGTQQAVWDPSCQLFGVTRPGVSEHPTVDFFGALTAAFIG
jgi:cell division protein FtsB